MNPEKPDSSTPGKVVEQGEALSEITAEIETTFDFQGLNLGDKTREALEAMVIEGASLPTAANKVDMPLSSLIRAFNRPHVRKRYNSIVSSIRENAAIQAYMRIQQRAETAQSEHVRQRADEWIAGVDGISPLKRVEGKHTHSHSFAGFDYAGVTIEGTRSDDSQSAGEEDKDPME